MLQFCKFGFVGILSVMVDYVVLFTLVELFGADYLKASAISYTFSVIVNYVLSMRYVFHGREDLSKAKEVSIFFFLSLVGLLLNQAIMWVAVDMAGMYYGLAKPMATFMVTWYNFISRKKCLE